METEQKQSTEAEQSERLQQNVEDTIPASRELKSRVKEKMIEYYAGDARRIHHFLKVHSFAKLIGEMEGVTGEELEILEVAALVHDIGIKPAEERYGKGHCGGKLQEQLGPEPARKMLTELEFDEDIIDRVCFLIAHHHTYEGAQGLDWQILLEADFLVNAFEDSLSKESIKSFRDKVFKTKTGIKMLEEMYGV